MRLFKVAVAAFVLVGALGFTFLGGVYAGARTGLFDYLRDSRTHVRALLTGRGGGPTASVAAPSFTRIYEAEDLAKAQAAGRPPANFDAWTGYYRIANSKEELAGHAPINQWLPAAIGPRLQPWARARMATTDGVADDLGQICQPTGPFRTTGFSGSFMFLPGDDKVVIVYGSPETAGVQRVYMNRTHPRNLKPTWIGDSVGYWEGDTLVIDSIGFNDKSWLHPTMEPHTEDVRWIQRIRQVSDGAFLEVHYTVEDRKALTSAYTYSRYYKRLGDTMPEEVCNDDLELFRGFRNEALGRELARAREIRP